MGPDKPVAMRLVTNGDWVGALHGVAIARRLSEDRLSRMVAAFRAERMAGVPHEEAFSVAMREVKDGR